MLQPSTLLNRTGCADLTENHRPIPLKTESLERVSHQPRPVFGRGWWFFASFADSRMAAESASYLQS